MTETVWRNRVHYEWSIELYDAHEDIVDLIHADRLADLEHYFSTPMDSGIVGRAVVLIRDECSEMIGGGYDEHDVKTRNHYYGGGYVPEIGFPLTDAPKRYQAEFARNREWAMK